jgi:ABC-type uncharacterized transport system auxiliary subunit
MRFRTKTCAAFVFATITVLAACGGHHHLEQYNFSGRTLALAYIEPPSPELLHGWYKVRPSDNTMQAIVRAGASVAKEVEARRASARLDSAALRVNVPSHLAQRTLERASRYLGTRSVTSADSADFVLEIQMRSFGIDARSNNATYLFTRAEAVLIDRRTGREIWNREVHGTDRLTPWVHGSDNLPSAVFTAATLHTVSVADFQEALEQLVTYTSTLITNELRDKLRDVRN